MSALLVGLSGVTNGGKTTLATNLMKTLPKGTQLIKQDDYFLPENSSVHVPSPGGIKHNNWDVITALDMDKMVEDLSLLMAKVEKQCVQWETRSITNFLSTDHTFCASNYVDSVQSIIKSLKTAEKRRNIFLIDGFTMFDDPRIRNMCDLKFFITLPKNVCFTRRQQRAYDPPDPPGYFDACVWPMYELHLERVRSFPEIQFYDGTGKMDEIFISVLERIASAAIS